MDQQHPPMNGNDDLAKTLSDSLQFEETPMAGAPGTTPPQPPKPAEPQDDDDDMKMPSMDPSAGDPDNEPYRPPTAMTPPAVAPASDEPKAAPEEHQKANDAPKPAMSSDLESLKTSALEELRPLVGKLNLPAEERFDTLLLVIRSTDDQSLLAEAHAAAKEIADDTRRAQALLDVIKEIDYFSTKR